MFDLFRNIVRQIPGRIGSLLFGIGEYAQSFEPYRAHEFQKLFEVGFGFARISDQQGRAQREVGNGLPQFVDQFVSLSWSSEICWKGMSRYLQILGSRAITSITSSGKAVG